MKLTRRDSLRVLAAAGAGLALQPAENAMKHPAPLPSDSAQEPALAARGPHAIAPLPFDPAKLSGLSERLLVSHHENNYAGAVKNLNKVREQIAGLPADAPAFLVAGLRERELTFRNSAALHELYFGNLGGNGKRGPAAEKALADGWAGSGKWEAEFRAAAMGLAGGSGWAILALDLETRTLGNYASGHHTQCPAGARPILVLDMYEHAFHLDFGAAAAKYVDAFFANLNWEEVERRIERNLRAAAALGA